MCRCSCKECDVGQVSRVYEWSFGLRGCSWIRCVDFVEVIDSGHQIEIQAIKCINLLVQWRKSKDLSQSFSTSPAANVAQRIAVRRQLNILTLIFGIIIRTKYYYLDPSLIDAILSASHQATCFALAPIWSYIHHRSRIHLEGSEDFTDSHWRVPDLTIISSKSGPKIIQEIRFNKVGL